MDPINETEKVVQLLASIITNFHFNNEILLIISIILYLGTFLVLFKNLGRLGIFLWVIISTLFANIEVLLNINAFGINMSLGNVLFASTFLATDVLSERYGRESANLAVKLGVITITLFLIFSQFWLLFSVSEEDFAKVAMNTIFNSSFRVAFVGVLVYFVCQKLDIFTYHLIWKKTEKCTDNKKSYLWLRNNLSTLTTQLVNNALFAYLAFAPINMGPIQIEGLFDLKTTTSIFISGYLIMAVLALIDTPFCYLCRKISVKEVI